jgi:hypothetical protein
MILSIDGMMIYGDDDILGEESVPAPFGPPQIARGVLSAIRNWQLTAWFLVVAWCVCLCRCVFGDRVENLLVELSSIGSNGPLLLTR